MNRLIQSVFLFAALAVSARADYKVTARHPIGGDGTLTVIPEDTPDKFTVVQNVITEPGCRTIAIDSAGGRVFLPTVTPGAKPAPTKDVPEPRAAAVPGSFHLVVGSR